MLLRRVCSYRAWPAVDIDRQLRARCERRAAGAGAQQQTPAVSRWLTADGEEDYKQTCLVVRLIENRPGRVRSTRRRSGSAGGCTCRCRPGRSVCGGTRRRVRRLARTRSRLASRRGTRRTRPAVATARARNHTTVSVSKKYKKLSYRRGTALCVVSIEILPIATQQCRN